MTKALNSKLGVGLKEIEEALNQIEANKTLTTVTLLVTTHMLGFCAAQIYFQCSAQHNPVYCNIYSFYQMNLAIFEARLYNVRRIQEAPFKHTDATYEIPVRPDFNLVMQTVNAYPDQIGRTVRAAGPITDRNEYVVPALACEQQTRQGQLIPVRKGYIIKFA